MPSLFDPIDLGAIHAPNRVLMAPSSMGSKRLGIVAPVEWSGSAELSERQIGR